MHAAMMPWHHRIVMHRIRVELPNPQHNVEVEVAANEGLVVGRAPDRSAIEEPPAATLRECVLSAPSVSAMHAVVWSDGARVHLRDLGSRNGSWVRVNQGQTLTLDGGHDMQLKLGFPTGAASSSGVPEPPRYMRDDEFGAGMVRAVQRWLAQREVVAHVRVVAEPARDALSFALESGGYLVVEVDRTVDDAFHETLVALARYVAAQNTVYAAEQLTCSEGMILGSDIIRGLHRRVVEAAMQSTPRLVLLGPSGTGKERLARAYHHRLGRSGPLVTVNCSTLSRDRMVADLFGAEAGAYTGAVRAMVGAVERADGGTLFLDEIGEMPPEVQSQLLRFLDSGEYQRLGATGVSRHADVHVVAATNRDLRAMVTEGTFRLDLFFRLALEVVEVPALRERFDDVKGYLATKGLLRCSALDALQPAALEALRQHSWPGNFRELINFAQRLPRDATEASINAATVHKLLATGAVAISPLPVEEVAPVSTGNWLDWVREAAAAYCVANQADGPRTWNDVTTFIEQYLKPHALVHIAGVEKATSPETVAVARVAETLKADRGTVIKQVRRYFESRPPRAAS